MKRIIVTALYLSFLHAIAFAQIFSLRPFEGTTVPTGSSFHDLLIVMTEDVSALELDPFDGASLTLGNELNFSFNYSGPFFTPAEGVWSAGHEFGTGSAINFRQVPNLPAFEITGVVDFGYIGGVPDPAEQLYFRTFGNGIPASGEQYLLYSFDAGQPGSDSAYSVRFNSGSESTLLEFMVKSGNGFGSEVVQSDSEHFIMYAGINADGSMTGEYLLSVSGQNPELSGGGQGLFYIGGSVSPASIPEASGFCLLVCVIIGGVVSFRRRGRQFWI